MGSMTHTIIEILLGAVIVVGGTLAWWRGRASKRVKARLVREKQSAEAEIVRLKEETSQVEAHAEALAAAREDELAQSRQASESSYREALKTMSAGLQSATVKQIEHLERIEAQFGSDSEVWRHLRALMHREGQALRRQYSLSLFFGGTLGRRNEPAKVYDVVRSGVSMIVNYDRVQITNELPFLVKPGPFVPALSHVVAELLDNATTLSPPDTHVFVNFMKVTTGLTIVIDDAGVGMTEEERGRAARILKGEIPPHIEELAAAKLGFFAVGRLCERFNFIVDVTQTSPYGGVRAIVFVPDAMLQQGEVQPPAQPVPAPAPVASAQRTPSVLVGETRNGLPRRGGGSAAAPAASVPTQNPQRRPRLSALVEGTETGRASEGGEVL